MSNQINEKVMEYADTYGEATVEVVSELLLEGVAGALIPGVTSFISAARTRRIEKNMKRFMLRVSQDIDEINSKYSEINALRIDEFRNETSEIILDYISDEREEEKIDFVVKGFRKLLDSENDINNTSLYFDVLKELRYVDILVLKEYDYQDPSYFDNQMNFNDFLEKLNLDYDRHLFIKSKLIRSGLLRSSYDKERKDVLEALIDLSVSLKDPKKKLSRKVTHPKYKKTERITLSPFGRAFINFFSDNEQS